MICGDAEADVVCLTHNGRVVVGTTSGRRLGPAVSRPCDAGTQFMVSAAAGVVCLGEYESGMIEAIDYGSGETRWKVKAKERLHGLHGFGKHILAEGSNGSASLRDGDDGREILVIQGTRGIACDTLGRGALIHLRSLEFRTRLDAAAVARFPVSEPFHSAAFAPGGVIVAQPGGLVRFYEIAAGKERWRYDCGEGSLLGGLGWCESAGAVFGVRWHRDGNHPPESLLLDGYRGDVRRRVLTPGGVSQPVVVNRGETAITQSWRCEIPTLTWSEWDTSVLRD